MFSLTVHYPNKILEGSEFVVTGELKYVGDNTVNLNHGKPIKVNLF